MPPSEVVCQPLLRVPIHICITDLLYEEGTRHGVERFNDIDCGQEGPKGRLRCVESLVYELSERGQESGGRVLGPKTVLGWRERNVRRDAV